jgi:hypothetical protein
MLNFADVFHALVEGKKVRLPKWDSTTTLSVLDGELVLQTRKGKPHSYDLSWYEINATDWQVVETTSNSQTRQIQL